MALVTRLELPVVRLHRPDAARGALPRGDGARLRSEGWLAQGPFGYVVLDREAAEFFLRTRAAIFPGMKIAEIFGVTEGPLYEQMRAQHPACQRPRPHAPAQPREPGAVAARGRALPPGDEGLPRASCSRRRRVLGGEPTATPTTARSAASSWRRSPSPIRRWLIATVMGAPLEDAPRLHHWSNWIQRQFDAASMASERDQIERGGRGVLRVRRGARAAARRESPGDDLISKLIEAEEEGERLERRRVHQPRVQRARRRRRHQPEPARARDQAARRTPRSVGAAGRAPGARAGRRSRRRCASSRSRRSPRAS